MGEGAGVAWLQAEPHPPPHQPLTPQLRVCYSACISTPLVLISTILNPKPSGIQSHMKNAELDMHHSEQTLS